MRNATTILLLFTLAAAAACGGPEEDRGDRVLRLATTTSTRDSGLLDVLLPPFEQQSGCRVDVVAVGTGAALRLASSGDADVVVVHARRAEEAFMADGHAERHEEFMANSFMIVGPRDDPAGIRGLAPEEAFRRLASASAAYVSRGDDSGTHKRGLQLRENAGVETWPELVESGQGMGATLVMADEMNAYVLCDAGTWLKTAARMRLEPLITSHAALRNPYAVMPVNAARHAGVAERLAHAFADYLVSPRAQRIIRDYRVGGQRLFEPTRLDEAPANR